MFLLFSRQDIGAFHIYFTQLLSMLLICAASEFAGWVLKNKNTKGDVRLATNF